VVIVYRPDPALLQQLVEAIRPQVDALWLMNNGSALELSDLQEQIDCGKVLADIIQLPSNLGIGEAIACAAERARIEGHTFLLTLDQDSIPLSDMVMQLLAGYRKLQSQGHSVAAVGPQQIDHRTGHHAAFIAPIGQRPALRRRIYPKNNTLIEVDHLITSGMLAPLGVYLAIGMPRADLFIDYVDIEWSLRARLCGYKLYAVGGAILNHSIGDDFYFFRGMQVPVHSPLRNYYLMRNGIFLQKLNNIPIAWKMSDSLQLLKKFVFFALFLPQRGKRIRMMIRGLRDGLCGRMGIYRERQ
jgi:rhamnosyltransferase